MYTAFVAATTFKLGVEKNPRHRVGFFRFCVALAEGQDVGVIVLTGQEDFVEVYCECGPGALDLAAMVIPMPVVHTRSPRSARPATTSCATREAKSG